MIVIRALWVIALDIRLVVRNQAMSAVNRRVEPRRNRLGIRLGADLYRASLELCLRLVHLVAGKQRVMA